MLGRAPTSSDNRLVMSLQLAGVIKIIAGAFWKLVYSIMSRNRTTQTIGADMHNLLKLYYKSLITALFTALSLL